MAIRQLCVVCGRWITDQSVSFVNSIQNENECFSRTPRVSQEKNDFPSNDAKKRGERWSRMKGELQAHELRNIAKTVFLVCTNRAEL